MQKKINEMRHWKGIDQKKITIEAKMTNYYIFK